MDSDEDWQLPRGRSNSSSTARSGRTGPFVRPAQSGSSAAPRHRTSTSSPSTSPAAHRPRTSFTRSRSPAVNASAPRQIQENTTQSTLSAMLARHQSLPKSSHLLPAICSMSLPIPFIGLVWTVSTDARVAAECGVLLVTLAGVTACISHYALELQDIWLQKELSWLIFVSLIYVVWMHSLISQPPKPSAAHLTPHPGPGTGSPRTADSREGRRAAAFGSSASRDDFGYVWMTVPKNYRDSSDDGIFSALMIGPMVSTAMLYSALRLSAAAPPTSLLPPTWRIEMPSVPSPTAGVTALQALVLARRNLVDLSTLCPTILLVHVFFSWWTEHSRRNGSSSLEGERRSVPRQELRRVGLYVGFSFAVALGTLASRALFSLAGWGFWHNMSYFEVAAGSLFYQMALYSAIRMAHRGFTLGELGLVSFGATVLFMELLNLTRARMWPVATGFVKTYRLPTPLLVLQIALIPGSLLTGFLLSPLLVLSRQIAQQPVRRLRFPKQKQKHRRLLAAGFYAGAVLIIGGLIGMWTRWCLGGRDPWLWTIFWLLEGRKKWSRPALLVYWALLGSISVAGWNRQLARSRRYRPLGASGGAEGSSKTVGEHAGPPPSTDVSTPPSPVSGVSPSLTLTFPALPNLPNGANVSQAATELLDAADKHVPTLSLNARRKFFHGLAVAMFLPGVAFDPAFAHLAFSAAFALFTFAEYVRYFALYPFGAAVHVFMNEFLDTKDNGTAILSHFYLLTGCANSLWLEAPSELLQYTGILALGIGDALASIVGKRVGRHRWSATTSKTLEGSTAFITSVVASAWFLRLCGLTGTFSTFRFAVAVGLSSVLEGLSIQNDNLTLPLYMWSVLMVTVV